MPPRSVTLAVKSPEKLVMATVLDLVVGALRPIRVRGKGRALDFITPRSGTRTMQVWDGA
jgi:hypothetical protein